MIYFSTQLQYLFKEIDSIQLHKVFLKIPKHFAGVNCFPKNPKKFKNLKFLRKNVIFWQKITPLELDCVYLFKILKNFISWNQKLPELVRFKKYISKNIDMIFILDTFSTSNLWVEAPISQKKIRLRRAKISRSGRNNLVGVVSTSLPNHTHADAAHAYSYLRPKYETHPPMSL